MTDSTVNALPNQAKGYPVMATEAPTCSLPAPVFFLFWPERFPTLGPAEYQAMDPALKLATRLITSRGMLRFWSKLHYGPIKTSHYGGRTIQYLGEPAYYTFNFLTDSMTEVMGKMARGLQIGFATAEDPLRAGAMGRGTMDKDREKFTILLSHDVHDVISGRYALKPHEGMRFQFMLARTLVRAIVPFFYHLSRPGSDLNEEPHFNVPTIEGYAEPPDLGDALEVFAFGNKVKMLNTVAWNSVAKSLFLYTNPREEVMMEEGVVRLVILPTAWVNAWFLASTWNSIQLRGQTAARPVIGSTLALVRTKAEDGSKGVVVSRWKLLERADSCLP